MGLFLQHKTVDMQWDVWKMEESLDTLFILLPDARRVSCEQEMQRFTSDRRKLEWLSVRVLLYSMLQEDKEIGYSSEGKPHLTDNSSFISISHTKGYVAVILSSVAPVGIDIEQYGQRVKRVYDRFIRSDERVEPYQGDETGVCCCIGRQRRQSSNQWKMLTLIFGNFVYHISFLRAKEYSRCGSMQRNGSNCSPSVIVFVRTLF